MSPRGHYPPDGTNAQWDVFHPRLSARQWRPGGPGHPPCDRRRVINGMLYVNKPGCQWRMLPKDCGHRETVYGAFRRCLLFSRSSITRACGVVGDRVALDAGSQRRKTGR